MKKLKEFTRLHSSTQPYLQQDSLRIKFPGDVTSSEDKIIFVLKKAGIQALYDLILFTGLPEREVKSTIKNLVRAHKIKNAYLNHPGLYSAVN